MPPDSRAFVDTNILLYAYDASETLKQPIARVMLEQEDRPIELRDKCGIITEAVGDAAVAAEPRYMTPSEAAAQLRVSTDTILRLIASGDLVAVRVSLRIIRIPTPAFIAFAAGRAPDRRAVVRRKVADEVKLGTGEPSPDLQPA